MQAAEKQERAEFLLRTIRMIMDDAQRSYINSDCEGGYVEFEAGYLALDELETMISNFDFCDDSDEVES